MILTAKDAMARHMQWRITLQFAIVMQEQLTPEQTDQITHHSRCLIGRWLNDPATLTLHAGPQLRHLVRKHIDFHAEMSKIASHIQARRFAAADLAMQATSSFQTASTELAGAISALDRVRSILIAA